jgi:hypothetical protein
MSSHCVLGSSSKAYLICKYEFGLAPESVKAAFSTMEVWVSSAEIALQNETNLVLIRDSWGRNNGSTWTSEPPSIVPEGAAVTWGSASRTFFISTNGIVSFHSTPGLFVFEWYVPFFGGNTYDSRLPPGYTASVSGGSGSSVRVTFTLSGATT